MNIIPNPFRKYVNVGNNILRYRKNMLMMAFGTIYAMHNKMI